MTRERRSLLTRSAPTGRRYLNLRVLPAWLQYVLALSIVAIVVAIAWRAGKDDPVPSWITTYLIPTLGWIYLALLAYLVLYKLFRRKR